MTLRAYGAILDARSQDGSEDAVGPARSNGGLRHGAVAGAPFDNTRLELTAVRAARPARIERRRAVRLHAWAGRWETVEGRPTTGHARRLRQGLRERGRTSRRRASSRRRRPRMCTNRRRSYRQHGLHVLRGAGATWGLRGGPCSLTRSWDLFTRQVHLRQARSV
ncbi:hypothetical protein T492DRAFT_1075611 [Pavlovales sp. CCMP2436]|nr:hypothetical protein T492DRAFT_1075611 [Pavlovales sp. CCMP2436]